MACCRRLFSNTGGKHVAHDTYLWKMKSLTVHPTQLVVEGSHGANRVLIHTPSMNKRCGSFACHSNVIFFGGDLQDTEKNMQRHGSFELYGAYSYERMIETFSHKFPTSNIILIQRSAHNGFITLYQNFCSIDETEGIYRPDMNGHGCEHLVSLLEKIDVQLESNFCSLPIHLIGFSRGANVLTQFVHELHPYRSDRMQSTESRIDFPGRLFDQVSSLYFLDGGNGGEFNDTLPTSTELVRQLACIAERSTRVAGPLHFHVYGSPRQWECQHRPWLGEERFVMRTLLSQHASGCFIPNVVMYSSDSLEESLSTNLGMKCPNKLFHHFEVIRMFEVVVSELV